MSDSSDPATRIGIIMAGGSGERFWPLSRGQRPKQLLKLTGTERTLLAEAVERLTPLIPRERLFVATGTHLQAAIRDAGIVPADNVWAEPSKRNTAGCLVWVAAQCLARFGDQAGDLSLAVVGADHRIGELDRFRQTVAAALQAAESAPVLATIGMAPTRPDTAFGYIEVAAAAEPWGHSTEDLPIHPVAQFREKPDRDTAQAFVDSGRFTWNTGMFCWRLGTFLDELERVRPAMARTARDLAAPLAAGDEAEARRLFDELESISIDYALMEQARDVVVVRGDFPWDDVGSWDSLERFVELDSDGNAVVGEATVLDSRDCVVYNEAGADGMAIGVLGVEGLVVVVAEDAVLVLPKERSQDVRRIVAELKARGARQV